MFERKAKSKEGQEMVWKKKADAKYFRALQVIVKGFGFYVEGKTLNEGPYSEKRDDQIWVLRKITPGL